MFQCTNANGYIIASYSLKSPGEPEYSNSSGCILEIAEQFGGLAPGAFSLSYSRGIVQVLIGSYHRDARLPLDYEAHCRI